jgi:hypothetical protein
MSITNTPKTAKAHQLEIRRKHLDKLIKKYSARIGGEDSLMKAIEVNICPDCFSQTEWDNLIDSIDSVHEAEREEYGKLMLDTVKQLSPKPLNYADDPKDEQEDILVEALRITKEKRNTDYGPPHIDFARTAKIWSAIFGVEIDSYQVGMAMIGLKMSRALHTRSKRDHYVDMAGYARCAWLCVEEANK